MADETTIQADVEIVVPEVEAPETDAVETEETPHLERDSIIADIAKRRSAERDEELEEKGLKPDEDPVKEVSDPDPEPDPEPASELIALKVNGQTLYKTQQEIDDAGGIPAIQKSLAGDLKLKEAAKKNDDVAQREIAVAERENRADLRDRNTIPAPTAAALHNPDELRTFAEDLVVGDVDKVAKVLEKVLQPAQPVNQPVDTNAIANQAAEITRQNIEMQNARSGFAKDFADVNDHPGKRSLANEHTKRLMRENPTWSPSQILTEAGNRTRADLSTPAPAPATPDPLLAKRNRKATTVDPIPHASTRKVDQPTENKPKTRGQIFEEMESSRSH